MTLGGARREQQISSETVGIFGEGARLQRGDRAPRPLRGRVCIYDAGAMRRWKEVEPPEKVVEQARKGGFLED